MSNPISTLPNAESSDVSEDTSNVAEIDSTETPIEVDEESAVSADTAETEDTETAAEEVEPNEERDSRGRTGIVILILAGLLLGSVAINLKQSRDVSKAEARSSEYQQALAAAVERIDAETVRADGAEAALDRVDSAVDVVNERVLGLQEALEGLREATVR